MTMLNTGQLVKEMCGNKNSNLSDLLVEDSTQRAVSEFKFRLQSSTSSLQLSDETDYLVKLFEDVLTLLRLLTKSETTVDYVFAITVFAQCRSSKSLTSLLIDQWERIMSFSLQGHDGETKWAQFKHILGRYESIKKLPIFTKLYRFLMYCIGTSLFEKLGISFDPKKFPQLEKAAVRKEYHLGPDFIHCMLDTTVFLVETGTQCMETGSLSPLFHHETTYEKWIDDGEVLRTQSRYLSNPEPHGFTVFDFITRMDDVIERGKAIQKFLPKGDHGKLLVSRLLSDLELIRADCKTKRLAQQERKAPFAVLVQGGSGVAKSQFTKMLFYHYGKLFALPTEDEYKYTRNAFDKYWTNFNTGQWCVQLDDIAYLHPNAANGCDPSLEEMLQVVNNVPYVPAQADLADKGRSPVQARFVIATSNTEHLNAEAYFACPLAVQRRLPYVICVYPKPQYCRDEGQMIDPAKIPPSEPGTYPDLWRIVVKKVVPVDKTLKKSTHMGQTGEFAIVGIFNDVITFIEWFNTVATASADHQASALKCDHDMSIVELCHHNIPRSACDPCAQALASDVTLQSLDIVQSEWIDRVMENREDESTPEEDDREYTMRHIWYEVSKMSLFTRIIVFWYSFLLYMLHHYPITSHIVYIFFGPWYWYILLARVMHVPEMRRIAMHYLGYRIYRRVRTPQCLKMCAAILAAVTFAKAGKLIFTRLFSQPSKDDHLFVCSGCDVCKDWTNEQKQKNAEEVGYRASAEVIKKMKDAGTCQGRSEEIGSAPEPTGDKHENVWYKDSFECTPADVTPSALSRVSWTLDDALKHIQNNCVAFTCRVQDGVRIHAGMGRALCIGGHVYVANNHVIKHDHFEMEIIFQADKGGVNRNFTLLVTPSMLYRLPEHDLVFININSIPPKKDIRSLFARASYEGRFDGVYVQRSHAGELVVTGARAPKMTRNYEHVDHYSIIRTDTWEVVVERDTVDGECGSALLVTSAMGPLILGIHGLGGCNRRAYAFSITQEIIEQLPFVIFGDARPTLQVGDHKKDLLPLSVKSECRYIESGTAEVHGSLSGFRSKMKSRVIPTLLQPLAVKAGYEVKTGPPLMNSYIPWRKALLDMTRPVSHIDQTLLEHCRDCFANDILNGLKPEDLAEVKVYDNMTAINGKPGVAYVDKLPRNTSAGFPFAKTKKFFMKPIPADGEYQHPMEVTPEILAEMDRIIVQYENSKVYCPVFTGSLKDEPTAFKKIVDGKTRVFCGAPLPWSIVVRKYYLPIIRLIQKNRILFEAGPGTIAQSVEWDELYRYLTVWGTDRIVAGDFEKFDKRMPACVIIASFHILILIMRQAKWTTTEIRVALGISEDVAFPTVDLNGTLYRLYGSNPSGHPLTVIINGIANCLYVRYCYAKSHPSRTCEDFKKNVHLMTYGDDMIMGVNPDCTWLNHTIMRDTLAEIDIGFTMADKTAESVPFIDIKDATFLRRSWRFEPELNCMVCPIEHDSIEKMLTMCVASKSVSLEIQALSVLDTACREYFWYGKETMEERRTLFKRWISELNLEDYVERDLPTWESLCAEFKSNSQLRA